MEGKTGADIEALCKQATQNAIREFITQHNFRDLTEEELQSVKITKHHFDLAWKDVLKDSKRSERVYQNLEGALPKDLYS